MRLSMHSQGLRGRAGDRQGRHGSGAASMGPLRARSAARERSRDPDPFGRPSPPAGDLETMLTELNFKITRLEHTLFKNSSDIALLGRQMSEVGNVVPAIAKLRSDVTDEYSKLVENMSTHQARLDRAEEKIPI